MLGQRGVEMEHQHRIGPGSGEQFLPLIQRGQAEGLGIGLEMPHRVRIERGDDARAAFAARPGHRLADHGLMAKMEAIEIAQREDARRAGFRAWVHGDRGESWLAL